eukprot:RCo005028
MEGVLLSSQGEEGSSPTAAEHWGGSSDGPCAGDMAAGSAHCVGPGRRPQRAPGAALSQPYGTHGGPLAGRGAPAMQGGGEDLPQRGGGEAESEEEDKDDAEVPPGELTGSETGSEKSTLQRFVRRLALRGGSGAWLFALLGRLELPLVPESQTVLQGFLHQCCAARVMLAELSPAATAGQGGS